MTSPDDEFDDFLRKRRPMFGRDDQLEPPHELDRVVLRQAREAIEAERPHRVFRAPSWGMPVALAATLVLAFTIILRVGTPEGAKKPEVTVQNVSREIEIPVAAAPPAPPAGETRAAAPVEAATLADQRSDNGAVVVDLGASAARAEAPAPAAQRARRLEKVADAAAPMPALESDKEAANYSQTAAASGRSAAAPQPQYRRTSKAWLAEIERLRAAGETTRADTELAEYKSEHRAYAGAPDR
jgi:hypothetical protein